VQWRGWSAASCSPQKTTLISPPPPCPMSTNAQADCLPDPTDVFVFLQDRGIGRDLALLYEAYATFLELKGAFPRADLVYQDGINRLAKPMDRLKQKHAAFQQRMVSLLG